MTPAPVATTSIEVKKKSSSTHTDLFNPAKLMLIVFMSSLLSNINSQNALTLSLTNVLVSKHGFLTNLTSLLIIEERFSQRKGEEL